MPALPRSPTCPPDPSVKPWPLFGNTPPYLIGKLVSNWSTVSLAAPNPPKPLILALPPHGSYWGLLGAGGETPSTGLGGVYGATAGEYGRAMLTDCRVVSGGEDWYGAKSMSVMCTVSRGVEWCCWWSGSG